MTDTFQDHDAEQVPEERTVTVKRSQIRALEEKAKRADEAEAAKADLERQMAFVRAGLPLDEDSPEGKRMAYFVRGYDGDLTPEAIRTAASDAGFLETTGTATAPPPDLDAHQRIDRAAAGASTTPPDLEAQRDQELRNAKSEREFDEIADRHGVQYSVK